MDTSDNKISFDDYLKSVLPKRNQRETIRDIKWCILQGIPIYVTGGVRTGKSTLVNVIRKHGGIACDDDVLYRVRLTKQIPLDAMINHYDHNIE